MKVHLVDGTYELFRAYYGAPSASGRGGLEVGATRAIARSLLSMVRRAEASHLGVAFDTVIESFRNQLFAGYKTGAGIEPALWSQFPLAEQAAEALGFVVWRMIDFEADDALATAAERAAKDPRVEQVVICSPDKDLCQCVTGARVVCLDRRREKTLDEAGVEEKFGVGPSSIPDFLALVGDTADGIPGVPRWGEKAAAAALKAHRHIEELPSDAKDWRFEVRGKASLADSLAQHRDVLPLYKVLATLRRDVPLSEDVDALEWRGAHKDKVAALSDVLEDKELIGLVPKWSSA